MVYGFRYAFLKLGKKRFGRGLLADHQAIADFVLAARRQNLSRSGSNANTGTAVSVTERQAIERAAPIIHVRITIRQTVA